MRILFENKSLQLIIDSIINNIGNFLDVNELLIVNNSDSKYKEIFIKPCTINITDNVVEVLGDLNETPDIVENELFDFVCYTKSVNEENQKIFSNISLFELTFLDKNILSSTGWKLIDSNPTESELNF